jgi:hypothetical protein
MAMACKTGSPYKLFVWRCQPLYVVMAHARTVAEARKLALEECRGTGDESTPVRRRAYIAVETTTPEIHYRENAEFVLTDSAELEEMEAYARVLAERIRELTGIAGISMEQYRETAKAVFRER